MKLIAIIGLVAAAASQSDQQFDLVCSGTISEESFYGNKSDPYTYSYRIDLAAKKFCESDCKTIRNIHDVQPGALYLDPPEDTDTVTKKRLFRGHINRETGKQTMLSTSGRGMNILILEWKGDCVRRPFSGFPNLQTKF